MSIDEGKPISGLQGTNSNQYNPVAPQKEHKVGVIFDWSKNSNDSSELKLWNTDVEKILNSNKIEGNRLDIDDSILPSIKQVARQDATRVAKVPVAYTILPPNSEKIEEENIEDAILNLPRNYTKYFDVTKTLFRGSAEDLNYCLANTKLKGQGKFFLRAQEKYGINALFLMSVAKVESGYGNKTPKGKPYNIVGAIGQHYVSYADCINKLGNNLHENYISKKLTTIDEIRSKYCKKNKTWPNNVAKEMKRLSDMIRERHEK